MNNKKEKGVSDEHYTPKWIFETLAITFDLDPCSPGKNKCHTPATVHYSYPQNGLELEWRGRVWMNPPYSNPTPWVKKFIEHKNGIALLPITRGKWWDSLWQEADGISATVHNLTFERPDGLKSKPIVFRTALYAYGQDCVKALNNFEMRVR